MKHSAGSSAAVGSHLDSAYRRSSVLKDGKEDIGLEGFTKTLMEWSPKISGDLQCRGQGDEELAQASHLSLCQARDGRENDGWNDSIIPAFSSMILMLKTLQTHALQMRSMLYYEDFESVADVVHRETQASFLWLFQQVFSRTPGLMVSVMLLFANFTLFSTATRASEVEREPVRQLSAATASSARRRLVFPSGSFEEMSRGPCHDTEPPFGRFQSHGASCSGDNESTPVLEPESVRECARCTEEDTLSAREADGAQERLAELLNAAVQDMQIGKGRPIVHLKLNQEVIRRLVAPVSVQIEEDDYVCYDRTELEYQKAISEDRHNSMLLSNYAQFLYIVRRDHDR